MASMLMVRRKSSGATSGGTPSYAPPPPPQYGGAAPAPHPVTGDFSATQVDHPVSGGGSSFSTPSYSSAPFPMPPPSAGSAPPINLTADTSEALTALSGRYNKHLDDLTGNSGRIMDIAGSRMRDAREGGRRALTENAAFAGKASDPSIAQYEADTTRGVQGAVADIAAQREGNLTSALAAGVGVARAAPDLALQEKSLQLGAYSAQQAAAQNDFSRWQALLMANRQSPIYTGR